MTSEFPLRLQAGTFRRTTRANARVGVTRILAISNCPVTVWSVMSEEDVHPLNKVSFSTEQQVDVDILESSEPHWNDAPEKMGVLSFGSTDWPTRRKRRS
jgi:hypothetical protein